MDIEQWSRTDVDGPIPATKRYLSSGIMPIMFNQDDWFRIISPYVVQLGGKACIGYCVTGNFSIKYNNPVFNGFWYIPEDLVEGEFVHAKVFAFGK